MNEKFFSLPAAKQQAIIQAGYRVFSQNSYRNSPMSEIAGRCRDQQVPPVPLLPQQKGAVFIPLGSMRKPPLHS